MKMIKSIKIEVGDTVLDIRIDHACTLRDELNALFSPVATNHPSKTQPQCVDQYSVHSTRTTADPDETWNPAG